ADVLGFVLAATDHIFAEHLNMPRFRRLQTDDRPQQHRLAGSRAADYAQNLAAADREVEIVVHNLLAKGVAQAFDGNDRMAVLWVRTHIQPMLEKKTAKTASSTITRKIDWTTAVVVRVPTSSLLPCTSMPWK